MSMVVIGVVSTVIGAGISISNAISARNARIDSENDAMAEELHQAELEANRQKIPNPYAHIKDLSHMIQNPYANLAVAQGAAKMQAEESDLALASTLDTLRASGSSAGGATALAQAALRSKKGIAANIEQQEVSNARARAQGEAAANQARMAEKQRIQGAKVAGTQFLYAEQEGREMMALDRSQARIDQSKTDAASAEAAYYSAVGDAGAAFTQGGMAAFDAYGNKKGGTKNTTITPGGVDEADINAIAMEKSEDQGVGAFTGSTPTREQLEEDQYGGDYGWMSQADKKSDRRLKEDIKLIGISPNGLNIYTFKYIDESFGKGTWQGVMSDEIPEIAVIKDDDGYDSVDYSKLDVEFKKVL